MQFVAEKFEFREPAKSSTVPRYVFLNRNITARLKIRGDKIRAPIIYFESRKKSKPKKFSAFRRKFPLKKQIFPNFSRNNIDRSAQRIDCRKDSTRRRARLRFFRPRSARLLLHYIQPPKTSLSGTPSNKTSERPAPACADTAQRNALRRRIACGFPNGEKAKIPELAAKYRQSSARRSFQFPAVKAKQRSPPFRRDAFRCGLP